MNPTALALMAALLLAGGADAHALRRRMISFPNCSSLQLASPDGRWSLIVGGQELDPSICPSAPTRSSAKRAFFGKIYLLDNRTSQRRFIAAYPGSGTLSWSADNQYFWYDSRVSNMEWITVYQVAPFRTIDINSLILATDTFPRSLLSAAGHLYFLPLEWSAPDALKVSVCGHTDHGPAILFDYRYTVSLSGRVRETSAHSEPFRNFRQRECP